MRTPAYRVRLSPEERQSLEELLRLGAHSERELRRAQVLLLADEDRRNQEIQALTGLSEPTVIAIKKRYLSDGLNIKEKPRPGRKPKLDETQKNLLLELLNQEAPEGRELWTMQLLADQLMQRDLLESISDETVRRFLKKKRLKIGRKQAPKHQAQQSEDSQKPQ